MRLGCASLLIATLKRGSGSYQVLSRAFYEPVTPPARAGVLQEQLLFWIRSASQASFNSGRHLATASADSLQAPASGAQQRQALTDATWSVGRQEAVSFPASTPERKEQAEETMRVWGEMLEEGNADAVLALLAQRFQSTGVPSLEKAIGLRTDEQELKEQRRQREAAIQQEHAPRRVRVVDRLGRAYATGKRKCSIARVWLWQGQGAMSINGQTLDHYFHTMQGRLDVLAPLALTENLGKFDVRATVKGGGTTGQAQALRHGISKALQNFEPQWRASLKPAGLLKRDPRVVERKKPGKAKARKSFQWVKR